LRPLNMESKQNGRIFAVLAVVASSLLGYGLSYAERSFAAEPFFNSSLASTVSDAIVSLAGAVPYITLFIALTIIVNHDGTAGELIEDLAGLDGKDDLTTPRQLR
jgi:hypothetical protein